MKKNQFGCYFIGDDGLLIEFAEILLMEGHTILGFITTNLQVRNWADYHQIKYFVNLESLADIIVDNPPDYIFSFVNNNIISISILKHVRCLTINYHNSLLPQYSGNHATSWAILNNEKQHGITWHVVTDIIDGGDILKQAVVPVAPNDTTLSLDLKCLKKAIEVFPELVQEIMYKNYTLVKQKKSARNYYALNQKPPGNGLINWSSNAKEIDCLCRALNFSLYTNRLASPKFIIENTIYIVQEIKIIVEPSAAPPGTIIRLSNKYLCVATATNSIKFYKVFDIDGNSFSIKDLVKCHNLKVGDRLQSDLDLHNQIEKTSSQFSRNESYWIEMLNSDNPPISLPFSHLKEHYYQVKRDFVPYEFQFSANKYLKEFTEFEPKIILLTILLIYLSRINNYQEGTITIYDQPFLNEIIPKKLTNFFAFYLPYSVYLQPEMQFNDVVRQVMKEIALQRNKKTYSRDIVIRYPSLREKKNQNSISITILDSNTEYVPSNDYSINFLISDNGSHLSMFVKDNLLLKKKNKIVVNNMKLSIHCLLDSIIENRYQPIKYLPLLIKDDYEKIVRKWSNGKTVYQKNNTLHGLIENQAKKNPNQYAVIYKENRLTYSMLNNRANHLAAYLRKKDVAKEESILLCINNSLELIIGILGILKAGCVYVPIDHSYNKGLIQYIIKDASSRIIITTSKLNSIIKQCLPTDTEFELVLIDTKWEDIIQEEVRELPRGNNSDLAYILYTSGSTGQPKGCLITHKNVINLLDDFQQKVPLSSNDVTTLWTSIGFDVSIYEIFSSLVSGATLHLFDRELISLNSYEYFKKLSNYQITSAYVPPFMLDKLLVWVKDNKHPMALKRLLVGVEPINESLLIEIKRHIPSLSIINGYGPTETTICSTLYIVRDYKVKIKRMVPIGKPVANTQIYILDAFMQPVPIGVLGELCIAGDGLTRGYLNKKELTETKFVVNPFGKDLNEKIYKTGDLACWLPDGNIEFHGRLDNQVKIRGFRIELNAIENCLVSHPKIAKAVANVENDEYKHEHITAYLQLNDIKDELTLTDIRSYLGARLSEYMIPSIFFIIDNVPITTNGKIDKKTLVSLTTKQLTHKDCVAPTSEVQQQLIQIWQKFFLIDKIGISDDFFALGGHSLLVAEMFTCIQQVFNKSISLQGFLAKPTIIYLAGQLEQDKNEKEDKTEGVSFNEEILLSDEIQPLNNLECVLPARAVLLTGVTGFVGIHILNTLYCSTEVTIYCLIKSEDENQAKKKLRSTLKHYCFADISSSPRIVVLVGDLDKPRLGLSEVVWQMLAENIDAIYHNGAWVHHIYNYETLKPTNVESTINLLKLSSCIRPKILHYFSTLTASISCNKEEPLLETFPQEASNYYLLNGGYEQTKWVSECLLAEAHRRGFAVNIFRLGWIGAQSKTGICSPNNNHFLIFIKACIQLGFAPDRNNQIDIIPVDIASNIIVNLSLLAKAGQVFHISNHSVVAWRKLIDWTNEAGYQVKLIPPALWHQKHLAHIDKTNALYTFLPLYNASDISIDWLSIHQSLPKIETYYTATILKFLGVTYPCFSKDTFFVYLRYLKKSGFL